MNIPRSLIATVLAFAALPASAEIIGVEQFDYPDGAIAGKNTGTFWDFKNTAPTSHTGTASTWDSLVGTPTVASGQLVSSGNSVAKREYNGNTETTGAVNDANVAKKVYYRVSVTTGPSVSAGDYFGFSSLDFNAEKLYFGKRGGSTTFGVEEVGVDGTNGGVTANSPTILPDTTYLLVAIVDFSNDLIRIFVDPDLNGAEPAGGSAAASRTYTGTNWSTAIRFSAGTAVMWDDLVVATTWEDLGTVVTTATDQDDGSLLSTVSLREAVKYSPAGTLVTFAPALSGQTTTLTGGQMFIPPAITIDASALSGGFTVDGNNASRHFEVQTGKSLTLRNLTFTRGNGSNSVGGAIFNNGGTLNLFRCVFTGNVSIFDGGAVHTVGPLQASDCTFSENTSAGSGGGLVLFSGTSALSRCTFAGNTASATPAIAQEQSTTTLSHCTVSGNYSTGTSQSRRAITALGGTLTLQHCTVSQNSGRLAGGGVALQNFAIVNVHSSIIAGNSDPSGGPADLFNQSTVNRSGTNLIGSNQTVSAVFPAGSPNAQGDYVGTAAAPLAAKLSPLGDFGGLVQTMHPLIGSLVIDTAGTANPGGTDARGFSRFVNGDAAGGPQLDIGAVEAGLLSTVSTTSDFGSPNSLRNIINTATTPGARIAFSGTAFPATIGLSTDQLTIPATSGLFIDASNISGAGVTISGNNSHRVFNIPATATVALHSLRIVGGNSGTGSGGGILNAGTCTVISATLSGNTSNNIGGGIRNEGTCVVISSTLSGNSGSSGGGIDNSGTCTVISSTLSGNSATGISGGGIFNEGTCHVISSTLSGNSALRGGGIRQSVANGTTRLDFCIIANNDAPTEANVSGTTTGTNNLTSGDPLLAPLGDYGGPTQTMALRPGSPARNAAGAVSEVQLINIGSFPVNYTLTFKGSTTTTLNQTASAAQVQSALEALATIGAGRVTVTQPTPGGTDIFYLVTFTDGLAGTEQPLLTTSGTPVITVQTEGRAGSTRTTDQRGFPLVGVPDLGAYEAGTITNYANFIWETLPNTASGAQHAATFDFDGDGQSNQGEYIAGTIVTNPASVLRITSAVTSGGNVVITFPTVTGKSYTLWQNDGLSGAWTNTNQTAISGDGSAKTFTIPAPVNGVPKRFHRVQVGP